MLFKALGNQHTWSCGCGCYDEDNEIEYENLEYNSEEEFIDFLRSQFLYYNAQHKTRFYIEEAYEIINADTYRKIHLPNFETEDGYNERLAQEGIRQEKLEQEKKEKTELQKKTKAEFEKELQAKENEANELLEYFVLRKKYEGVEIPFEDLRLEFLGFAYRFERLYKHAQTYNLNLTSFTINKREAFRLDHDFGPELRIDKYYDDDAIDLEGNIGKLPNETTPYARYSPERKNIDKDYPGIPVYLSDKIEINDIHVGYNEEIPSAEEWRYNSYKISFGGGRKKI